MKKIKTVFIIIVFVIAFTACKRDKIQNSSYSVQEMSVKSLIESGYEILHDKTISIEFSDLNNTSLISAKYNSDGKTQLKFFVAQNDDIIYTLPEFSGNINTSIQELKKVINIDINDDDIKDIVIYATAYTENDSDGKLEYISRNYILDNNLYLEGESLWREVEKKHTSIWPYKNDKPIQKLISTYNIQLKIPSLFKEDELGTDYYGSGGFNRSSTCVMWTTLYEIKKDENFISNVRRIYLNPGEYSFDPSNTEVHFDNVKLTEGITNKNNKYVFIVLDNETTNGKIQKQVFMYTKINSDIILKIYMEIFEEDFDKYDMEFILNSINVIVE